MRGTDFVATLRMLSHFSSSALPHNESINFFLYSSLIKVRSRHEVCQHAGEVHGPVLCSPVRWWRGKVEEGWRG